MRETFSTTLYDPKREHSACGVGFITRKDSKPSHEVLRKGHEALCAIPHRGGMSSTGVGDGAGISVDLSSRLFSKLTGTRLESGRFGVGNFFMPERRESHERAIAVIEAALRNTGLETVLRRELPVDAQAIEPTSVPLQLPIVQWIFRIPEALLDAGVDAAMHHTLLAIETIAYADEALLGLYPLSLSARTQVLKGRLNAWELVPYFADLSDPDHRVHTLFFHTRFSTNTDPHPSMAQPFRLMAHNGELNTDKKNRLSEAAIAKARRRSIVRPPGQSDSCRFDQTLNARVFEDDMELVSAVVSMMPPAWENDERLPAEVRDMLAYFSLYEEKNDGPAALIFGDGNIIGARLDRLGLRPLRTIETHRYLAVTSEAGQISFPEADVIHRGRIEAGGMLFYDHSQQRLFRTEDGLRVLAEATNYKPLLNDAQLPIATLPEPDAAALARAQHYDGDLCRAGRYVGYTLNQESFRFLMDPMLDTGAERVSAMGYGTAINALSDNEGGVAKYFSQRFAQVTNPPLDSLREADGMTLRIALGEKPHAGPTGNRQIVLDSPILTMRDIIRIKNQTDAPCLAVDMLYAPDFTNATANERKLVDALDHLASQVAEFAQTNGGIAILSDRHLSSHRAPLPMTLAVSAVNQRLIEDGLRLRVSIIVESGQIASSHHVACALGFGASAVYALSMRLRAEEKYPDDPVPAYRRFAKAAEKALLKTMAKVGLCTVESYCGGEFFEPNFLDTNDPIFRRYFPNMLSPVGGVRFDRIAQSVVDWHRRAAQVSETADVPMLGLFKERAEGAGHSYGTTAVRGFVDLTEESLQIQAHTPAVRVSEPTEDDALRLLTLNQLEDAFGIQDDRYVNTSFDALTPAQINGFQVTSGYREFSRTMASERAKRPAALRDVLAFPADVSFLTSASEFMREMMLFNRAGNLDFVIRGLTVEQRQQHQFILKLSGPKASDLARLDALAQSLVDRFGDDIRGHWLEAAALRVDARARAEDYLARIRPAPPQLTLEQVQPASDITPRLASGAMSHGALVAQAHEAVAHGTNMVGGMSNCGEGGEHISRYGTLRASRIKQFASGRFGVWAGYLADPKLAEIEIKIGQGAKPGEGGQLPAPKVTVEIAAARGGTPGVELISPPPHHDTYSIEDLAQLIHDAKATRARVIVKLVSSEGIGTIAVGVAKAGADVINVAGSTGGTGAASVTSLKYTGRAAELGIAEVHQALCENRIRQKVQLRCSGAMQTGSDVVKACLLGGDSFEFGTTALMMLKCVMAKNCNVKCPAGLTTNPEVFDGDPRALAQYLLNIAHEVREVLAHLGFRSLDDARGRADLLHLLDHPASVGRLDLRAMLVRVPDNRVQQPVYLERNFATDDRWGSQIRAALFERGEARYLSDGVALTNGDKSVGGQLAIDLERWLNHDVTVRRPSSAYRDDRGRYYLAPESIALHTSNSAGQSYGAFCNDGMVLHHAGTCNDGVGKSACGGMLVIVPPEGSRARATGGNVLVGNFALFGATGGRLFIAGEAGDRFAVRNSGASAVVEGVGEFCCEYMTNGSVLNLGPFASGFGNGMSGGFAYQYDPEGRFTGSVSHDSVIVGSLTDDDPMAAVHEHAIALLLRWHEDATGSALGRRLRTNWAKTRTAMRWVMPRALLQYQDAHEILNAHTEKALRDELANALTQHLVGRLKVAWKTKTPLLQGRAPTGASNDDERYALLNNWTVLDAALEVIRSKHGPAAPRETLDRMARNLILTEDHALLVSLVKHARSALTSYTALDIAVLLSHKRLDDFKRALSKRNARSMDSPATYGWILMLDQRNRAALGRIPSFEELFAQRAVAARAQVLGA